MRPHQRSSKRYQRDRKRRTRSGRRRWRTEWYKMYNNRLNKLLKLSPVTGKALPAADWLALSLFTLFPTTSWKDELPVFDGPKTGNTGIIWGHTVFPGSENGEIVLGGSLPPKDRVPGNVGVIWANMVHGMDLMRGFDHPYPEPNPTIRVVDAETGLQYYPNEITVRTPGASRMRIIAENGEDLTAKYHVQTYDTATGLMTYFEKDGLYDHAHTCCAFYRNVKIVIRS